MSDRNRNLGPTDPGSRTDELAPADLHPGSRTDEPRTPYYREWAEDGQDADRSDHDDATRSAGTEPAGARDGTRVQQREHAEGHTEHTGTHESARDRFGGINWGSAFFGWLVAVGMTALLTGLLSAAGAAIGLNALSESEASRNAETISLLGGIALLLVTLAAFFCGGYVAGRMSRFDGARQGAAVWILGLLVTIALGAAAVVLGSEYNVLDRVGLPRLPIGEETLTTAGIIATAAILLGTLIAAIAGGKAGHRYHNLVDREAGFAGGGAHRPGAHSPN